MIIEERIYTIRPGRLGEMIAAYRQYGLEPQTRILGNLLGYFTTEIGPLSTLVHMWGYEDLSERERRRVELVGNADWQKYLQICTPMIVTMDNRILTPLDFSPIR